VPEHITPKWLLKALTPPIVVIAVKGLLRRLGLLSPAVPDASAEPADENPEPPEFEVVPDGWTGISGGWDAGAVADAYLAKWPEWVAALERPGPLGVSPGAPDRQPSPRAASKAACSSARPTPLRRRLTATPMLEMPATPGRAGPVRVGASPAAYTRWSRATPTVGASSTEVAPPSSASSAVSSTSGACCPCESGASSGSGYTPT